MDLRIRDLELSKGRTKLALVVLFRNREEIIEDLKKLEGLDHDLIELRYDYLDHPFQEEEFLEDLALVRKSYDKPILFTLRTREEGGFFDGTDEEYYRINSLAIESGLVDLIDLEISKDDSLLEGLLDKTREAGILSIASSHNFEGTDSAQDMRLKMERVKELGFSIGKLAQMARNRMDVFRLMEESYLLGRKLDLPIISISMGDLGRISRIAGELTESVLSFAPLGQASAPGQIDRKILSDFLKR